MVIIMKKVIETNVSFDDVRNKYIVKIKRNRAEFRYDADSLDEAKSVKSLALDFYANNDRMPSRTDLGLKRGHEGRDGLYTPYLDIYEDKCVNCGRTIRYTTAAAYSRFKKRGRSCKYCCRDRKARKPWASTNVLNVSYMQDRVSRKYRVSLQRDGQIFFCNVETMEEAIEVREKALAFYQRHKRLPSKEERNTLIL